MRIAANLRNWLHASRHVHLRERRVHGISDLVKLIDNFLDGTLSYGLEWDDFISWEHENPNIEATRGYINRIPDLYHPNLAIRRLAVEVLVVERNRIAALIGLPPRDRGPQDFPPELREIRS